MVYGLILIPYKVIGSAVWLQVARPIIKSETHEEGLPYGMLYFRSVWNSPTASVTSDFRGFV